MRRGKLSTRKFALSQPLNHIAFIMDGNGRWAKSRGMPRTFGHLKGCQKILPTLYACMDYGIKVISFFLFSTENWKRPEDEIRKLFEYLREFISKHLNELIQKGVRITTLGDITKLDYVTYACLQNAKNYTEHNHKYILNLCLNYGGKQEIEEAAKKSDDSIPFSNKLESFTLPDVDLMIRTGKEQRISNFMLWKLAYAELIFRKEMWPEFNYKVLEECIKEYDSRKRRYGGIENGKR